MIAASVSDCESGLVGSDQRLGLRDWSLIMGRGGGYKTGGGGHVKFYPYKKGGRKKF